MEQSQKSHRKKYVWLGAVTAVGIIILLVTLWSTSGNTGTTTVVPEKQAKHGPAFVTYSGNYMSFTHSSSYNVRKLPLEGGNDLEAAMLTADASYQKHLSVTVSKLPDGTLNSNGSYYGRRAQSNLYSAEDITADGSSGVLFTLNDNKEITVYIQKGSVVTALSFSTSSSYDDLRSEVNAVLASYHWKK